MPRCLWADLVERHVNYAPTLIVTESKEAVRREKLVEWTDEARANELADWLRERSLVRAGNR